MATLKSEDGFTIYTEETSDVLRYENGFTIHGQPEGIVPPTEVRATRYDISGNARHLYDVGTVTTQFQAGKIGNAILFDGSGMQSLWRSTAPDLRSNVSWALAFWFRMALTDGAPGSDINWHLDIGTLALECGFRSGETSGYVSIETPSLACDSGAVITADALHLLVAYFDGAKLALRLNNQLIETDVGVDNGIAAAASAIEMGFAGAVDMTFALDEIGLYVDASMLTTDQMTALWNNGNGVRPSFS